MSAYPDDEVSTLIAGVLNDHRTPSDPDGRARTIRDVLSAARMLGPSAYSTADQISLFDESGCRRDSECVLGDAHGGACRNRAEEDEWQAH